MKKKLEQKKRKVFLQRAISFMVAGIVIACVPGTAVLSFPSLPISAAEAEREGFGGAALADGSVSDALFSDADELFPDADELLPDAEAAGDGDYDLPADGVSEAADGGNPYVSPEYDESYADEGDEQSGEGTQEKRLEAEFDTISAAVIYTESAGIPDGSELKVERIDHEDGRFLECYDSAREWLKDDELYSLYRLSLLYEDGEVELLEKVKVVLYLSTEGFSEFIEPTVYQYTTDEESGRTISREAALLDYRYSVTEPVELEFETESLSEYSVSTRMMSSTDIEENAGASEEGDLENTSEGESGDFEENSGTSEEGNEDKTSEEVGDLSEEGAAAGADEDGELKTEAEDKISKDSENRDRTSDEKKNGNNKSILKGGKLTAEADGVTVTVSFSESAGLPEGTELKVKRIDSTEKTYDERYDSAREWIEGGLTETEPTPIEPDPEHSDRESSDAGRPEEESVGVGRPEEESVGAEYPEDESVEAESLEDESVEAERPEDESVETEPLEDESVEAEPLEDESVEAEPLEDESVEAEPLEDESVGTGRPEDESIEAGRPEGEIAAFALFDISLVCDGKEIEPLESVQVELKFTGKEFSEADDLIMIHYAEKAGAAGSLIESVKEQEVASDKDGRVEASFAADSFSEYAVLALRAAPYTVWFDGTDGMGTGSDMWGRRRSLYNGATNVSQTIYTDTVTLPTTAGTIAGNKYTLNGWYDINTGNYYKPGDTATIDRDTVFYAEWVQTNYNLGPAATVVSNQPDVSSFVTTDVFDYNEIFNAYHGAVVSGSSVNQYSHSETWRDSQNNSNGGDFLFTNWYYQNFGEQFLGFASNLKNGRNRYAGAGDITGGIVSSPDDSLMQDLFGTSDIPGKVYLGQGNMLYQYDGNQSSSRYGYYYYDSDKNAADYNQNDGRFYVYTGTQTIRGEWNDAGTNVTGFMPFEQGTATINQKTGQVNFWFGMVSTVDFFLPDDPGTGGNRATGDKDMEFYFSGDDDVWVFVDDVLLLDLGGIHREINGSINFSDGNIYVEGRKVGEIPDSIKSGDHKLKFYYLERGSSWSNASIYFNIAPRYSLELIKHDADNASQLLEGAVFNLYMDENCTIPVSLWESKEACDRGDDPISTLTTGPDGRVSAYGMYANRTLYMKEVSAPPGYPSISGKVIALQLDSSGKATIIEGNDIAALTQDEATKYIDLSVENKLPENIEVPVEKHWYNEDGSQFDPEDIDGITVELYSAEFDVPTGGGSGGTGGSTGGNTGAVLPVNIRTQYFGTGNGDNHDTSVISQGDLTANAIVTSGGSLTINLNVSAAYAGIYSVTVNGQMIRPVSSSLPTSQNCFIGGSWGNYPPRRATYVIDPVTEALDVRVTLIGYLSYVGSNPAVSYSMSIGTVTAEPPAEPEPEPDPGSGEEPEAPEIPSVMPEDAEYVTSHIITEADGWKHIFTDLPARSEDGSKIYVYYVKEIFPDGYSTSYIGNGSTGGEVSIYNVRLRELIVKKEWQDVDGNPLSDDLPESISLIITQYDETAGTQRMIPVTLSGSEDWTARWRSNSSELAEQEGHTYRYRITEVNVGNEYQVTYSENNLTGVTEGTIIVTNREKAYSAAFVKADSIDHTKQLSGAAFSIYSALECDEEHLLEAYDTDSPAAEPKTVFTSGEDGMFTIYGLKAGTYYLKELSAPEGYYLINYPLEVVITDEMGGVQSVRAVQLIDGEVTEVTEEAPVIELVTGSITQIFIYDSPLFELPSTGGFGSYLFIVSGIAVMFTALLLNIKSFRKEGV